MPSVHAIVGRRSFPDLQVPDGCTVGAWKELLRRGHERSGVHGARRLVCFADGGSRVLVEDDLLPVSPREVYVEGPTAVLGALTLALSGGSANHKPPAKPYKRQRSPRRMFFLSGITNGRNRKENALSDDTTSNHDRASAEAILEFWFEELSQADWFRLSHLIDDRIGRDFGALHRRAAAGELAGWKARPETCLALVVMLDQFSRRIYRGTAAAYACDGLAREAASAALIRGDDHHHWPAGPRRCALYLPFVHIDDTAEKKQLFAALGARDSATGARNSIEELQQMLGAAANSLGPQVTVADHGAPAEEADTFPNGKEEATLSSSSSGLSDGSIVLPQLTSCSLAGFRRKLSAFIFEQEVGNFSDVGSSVHGDTEEESPRAGECATLKSSDSGASLLVPDSAPAQADFNGRPTSARRPASAGPPGGTARPSSARTPHHGQPTSARRAGGGPTLSKEIAGSYPVQVATELPKIPSLTLNHEFGRRFRAMKLDKKTKQAYERDSRALNVTKRYHCLVCTGRHDFRFEGRLHGGK